ncbi:molybdopterin molybdenumtransferase MoeA [Halomonas sp. TRM85114]|uniref:molybdopterin molybdotransferase MoeA n=1 Tax=Halomonas jincaotanensis TaxID=2810616 RepID=UPI001BD42067|nr:gephyrin-like molybdotransferase Glp [Halomonas jincaotanensis]MBS9404156.1 molybdopterin molybdenumtransferase MoeA [Halomonas jincaotanensis]
MTLSCFDLGERMLAVEEAREAILALATSSLASEALPLSRAHGRVLAESVISPIDVPGNTNAAMDGIALEWSPTVDATSLWRRVGQLFAGQQYQRSLAAGECLGITTGAPMPPGADTVIMREQLEEHDGQVVVNRSETVKRGQHVRQAGEDIARGQLALAAGTRVSAAELGLLASLGFDRVRVVRRPRVALFSTGNEVTAPGSPLPPAGLYDANRFTLQGLVIESGGEPIDLGILSDDRDVLIEALDQAASQADLIITSGGVSVGEADFTRSALTEVGELGFWRIAIRPGRPLACGTIGSRRVPFLGLPGNPVAVMITYLELVAPLLARLQGRDAAPMPALSALAEHHMKSREGRVDYVRGVYSCDNKGQLSVRSTGAQGSGILSSMVMANCLIEISADRKSVEPGEAVTLHPLYRLP